MLQAALVETNLGERTAASALRLHSGGLGQRVWPRSSASDAMSSARGSAAPVLVASHAESSHGRPPNTRLQAAQLAPAKLQRPSDCGCPKPGR